MSGAPWSHAPGDGARRRLAAVRPQAGRVAEAILARPLHAGLVAFVLGLLCGPRAPAAAVAVAVPLLLAVGVITRRSRSARRRSTEAGAASGETASPPWDARALEVQALTRRAPGLLVAMAVAVLLGAVLADGRAAALDRTALGPELGRSLTARVVVQEAPRRSSFGGWSGLVELRGEPVLLRVRAVDGAPPGAGTILAVDGELRRPGPFAQVRRAHAELSVRAPRVVGRRGGVAGAVDGVRLRAEAALDRGLPPAAAGLLRGMVLGQDDALPETTRDAFRAAGLSHLVAASGTNVVLLAALAMVLGAALGLGLTARLWLVLGLIALYVPLAGAGPSIQRAGIMGAAAVAAGLVGRPASRWYALALAAALTLLLDPRAAEDPGWQLSFVAVVSLLVLAPHWRAGLVARGLPVALAEVTAMTAAATLATAPVAAAHFGETSLVAIPANVLAAPAVAPVMWLGVVAAAVGQLLVLGGTVELVVGAAVDGAGGLAGFPLGYLDWIATTAAAAPGAVVTTGPLVVCLVALVVGAVTTSRAVRRGVPLAAAVGAAAWIGLRPPPVAPAGAPAGLRVTFLDVGQGDATLVQDGPSAVLVDAGTADAGILGLLDQAGIRRLDLFVASHASADHEGGAGAVLAGVPVGAVLDGRDGVATPGGRAMAAAARARAVPLVPARAGQLLRVGGMRLRVLWPPAPTPAAGAGGDPNERAVVLEVEARGARVLLTADAESGVLSRLGLRRVDVLKVPHHGSADPGLPRVLERLRPRVAGIEVGEGNSYGHPAPSTLEALRGVPVLVRTDRDGSVRLDLGPSGRWEVRARA